MQVGDIRIEPVHDGHGFDDASVLTRPGVPDAWDCHPGALDEHGLLHFDFGGFLIRLGDRVILIDTGAGRVDAPGLRSGQFLHSLAALGVQPGDVTDVLITHLHHDHVGWATSRGEIVFPNATYRVHRDDWAHFVESPDAVPGAVGKLTPLTERIELFEHEHTVAPGIDARPAPGHTPGTTIYVVSSGTERALLLGDVVHSVVELLEPDWEALYDVDAAAAQAVRNAVVAETEDTGTLLVPGHFPSLSAGRILRTQSGRRWVTVS